jgi:TRAP transporter TAXI family solute receptor
VLDLTSTSGITAALIPHDEVIPALQSSWGRSLYRKLVMARASYPGQEADVPVVAVDNALVVDAGMDEQLAYDLTRTLFERKADLVAIHPEARHLSPDVAVQGSPAAFHPGAIRYYRERGVWSQ